MKLTKSSFTENLIRLNSLRFKRWIFEPGMLFLSETKWWAEKGYRSRRHNGLDLQSYETDDGTSEVIGSDIEVPIIYEGRITHSIKDFLGYSLFAAHEVHEGELQLYTIYGHVNQMANMQTGEFLTEGAAIATPAVVSNAQVPVHLHISVVLIPKTIPTENLTWQTLDNNPDVRFFDPADII